MGSEWRKVWAIARKDLLIELRRRDVLSSAVVFTLLVLLVFNFALDLTGDTVRAVAPGILWVTFIFAGMLTLSRTFARERERGALQGLLLAPLDRGALFLAKLARQPCAARHWSKLSRAPAFAALYDLPLRPGPLLAGNRARHAGLRGRSARSSRRWRRTRGRARRCCRCCSFPCLVPVIIGAVKATAATAARCRQRRPALARPARSRSTRSFSPLPTSPSNT